MKKCKLCKQSKDFIYFDHDYKLKSTYKNKCKDCIGIYRKQWYIENKDREIQRATDFYKNNREKCNNNRKIWLKNNPEIVSNNVEKTLYRKYKITGDEYKAILCNQNDCCAICKKHYKIFKRALAVDHCHKTGKNRGLLCQKCNTALGLLNDDINILNNSINYLKNHD